MHIRCPECRKPADLANDFSKVSCGHCGYSASYREYIVELVKKDVAYQDVLGDYQQI